jgi:outer membrane protein assembly factor BamB
MVFAGSINGLVSAVDLEMGRRRWSARAGDDQTTVFAPVADERIVVAGFTSFGEQSGGVAAWDTRTGRERWRVRLGATGSPGGVTGGPVLTERFVAVTSRDGTIAVIERETGRVTRVLPAVGEAAIPGGEPVSQDFRALLAFDRGRALLAGSLTGVVILYDAETGRERWRHRPVAASIGFAIAEDGQETAYLPYLSGPLVAVDTKTGAERWRTRSDDGFSWAPRAWHGALYASASRTGFFAFVR